MKREWKFHGLVKQFILFGLFFIITSNDLFVSLMICYIEVLLFICKLGVSSVLEVKLFLAWEVLSFNILSILMDSFVLESCFLYNSNGTIDVSRMSNTFII